MNNVLKFRKKTEPHIIIKIIDGVPTEFVLLDECPSDELHKYLGGIEDESSGDDNSPEGHVS